MCYKEQNRPLFFNGLPYIQGLKEVMVAEEGKLPFHQKIL
jgi:hypothetical protein